MKLADKMLYAMAILAAVALATVGFCLFDWVWAIAVIGAVAFWATLLFRKCHRRS